MTEQNRTTEEAPEAEDATTQDMQAQAGHRCGWVALIGPPNAGKSTLLNAFLGQKIAIVTPKPQTTRNCITGILSQDNAQVIFFDTPGVHNKGGWMNRALLQTALQALSSSDVIMPVLDAELYSRREAHFFKELDALIEPVREAKRPILVLANKVDRVKEKAQLLPLLERLAAIWPGAELFPVSALRKTGLDAALHAAMTRLPLAPPQYPPDQASTLPLRFMAAEIIREKLFMRLHEELPYSLAVDIETWDESPDGRLTHVGAVVYVARASHKPMVIGKHGAMLKEVGMEARKELKELLETKVHLEIWVRVKEGWPEDPTFLRSRGLAT